MFPYCTTNHVADDIYQTTAPIRLIRGACALSKKHFLFLRLYLLSPFSLSCWLKGKVVPVLD
jgi:hypothetical protein